MEIVEIRRARLKEWFTDRTLPPKEKSYLSQLMTGKASFGEKSARRLERDYGMPEKYLDQPFAGLTTEYIGPDRRKFDTNVSRIPPGLRPVPVISEIQAGRLKEIADPYPPGAGFAVEYSDDPDLSRWAFALEIDGMSMMPEFRPGDRVIIDPELAPNPGDFVAARNTKEEATFKKYRPRGMDANGNMVFELVPLNPDYPTMRSDIEHLEVIGVMVEHRKKFRRSKS